MERFVKLYYFSTIHMENYFNILFDLNVHGLAHVVAHIN